MTWFVASAIRSVEFEKVEAKSDFDKIRWKVSCMEAFVGSDFTSTHLCHLCQRINVSKVNIIDL